MFFKAEGYEKFWKQFFYQLIVGQIAELFILSPEYALENVYVCVFRRTTNDRHTRVEGRTIYRI